MHGVDQMPQELQDPLLWVCLGALVLLEQHGKWITSISSTVLLSQGLQNGADILILDDSIVFIDRGPELPEAAFTVQGEKQSTLNVMREEALGEPRRKSLEGFQEAVLSKLGLKNKPGKREKGEFQAEKSVCKGL